MSVRDEFAIAAMQGMLANPNNTLTDEEIAASAYTLADAMLKHVDLSCPVCRAKPDKEGKIIHQSGCPSGWEV